MPSLICDAVIFDLDGVLIDSDAIYEPHWRRWAERHDVPFEDVLAVHHGRPAAETIRAVAPHLDAEQEAKKYNAVLEKDTDLSGLRAYEGAARIVGLLPPDRWAIATSAPRRIAPSRLQYVDLPIPNVLVTPDDVKNGKPAPDPYVRAAEGLGIEPSRCVVIEDAPAGIEAARKAGARVIAVASTHSWGRLRAADVIVSRLSDLEVSILEEGLQVTWPVQAC